MLLDQYFAVSRSASISSFETALVKFAHDMEFPLISGALVIDRPVPGSKSVFLPFGNTPKNFIEIAHDIDDGRRSPVNQLLKRMSIPIVYDQDLYASAGAGDIWEKHAPFGYKTGIAVALHLPGNKHFLLGVDRPDPLPSNQVKLTRLMADLQLLAVHAQASAEQLLGTVDDEVADVRLSPRELEILRWTMDGKSAWAVAQLLGISAHTVDYHVRSICRKFNVSSKHHAVLKAVKCGLI